jgi:hypothetical protein
MLIGAHPALRRVLVEDVRQKDKINARQGDGERKVRVIGGEGNWQVESGRAIGASYADATREGGDIRMSSSSQSRSTRCPPASLTLSLHLRPL